MSRLYNVILDGNFEASPILQEHLWQQELGYLVDKAFSIVIPARDIPAFCDADSVVDNAALRGAIEQIREHGDHFISDRIFLKTSWCPSPRRLAMQLAKMAPGSSLAGEPGWDQALVEQARQAVLEQFKSAGGKARELALQRGMQEGLQAGAEEARKTFESELTRVRSIAGKLQAIAETGIKGLEDTAVAIAFEAVCKILGAAAMSPEGIRSAVQEAVAHAVNTEEVAVRLHLGDLAALRRSVYE